jgi:hypothetical protein
LTGALLEYAALATVNVKSYRAMRVSQELDYRTMLTSGRGGKVGAAVIVLMPEAAGRTPNVTGPILQWNFPVVVIENDSLNMQADQGTLISAEEIAQMVLDALHHETDTGLGTFTVAGTAMRPESGFVFPGCLGYRLNLLLSVGKTTQTARVAPVAAAVADGLCTLTCATASSSIYYTTDGTFPGASNAAATLYSAPFAVTAGQVVRAAGYKSGLSKSATTKHTVT